MVVDIDRGRVKGGGAEGGMFGTETGVEEIEPRHHLMVRALVLVGGKQCDGQLDAEGEAIEARLPDDAVGVLVSEEEIPAIKTVSFLGLHLRTHHLLDAVERDGDL